MTIRIAMLMAALGLCRIALMADSVPRSAVTPIDAHLLSDIRARQLKVGESVFARVDGRWESAECVLRDGAILEGHVLAVVAHTKTEANSEVTLAFTKAQC